MRSAPELPATAPAIEQGGVESAPSTIAQTSQALRTAVDGGEWDTAKELIGQLETELEAGGLTAEDRDGAKGALQHAKKQAEAAGDWDTGDWIAKILLAIITLGIVDLSPEDDVAEAAQGALNEHTQREGTEGLRDPGAKGGQKVSGNLKEADWSSFGKKTEEPKFALASREARAELLGSVSQSNSVTTAMGDAVDACGGACTSGLLVAASDTPERAKANAQALRRAAVKTHASLTPERTEALRRLESGDLRAQDVAELQGLTFNIGQMLDKEGSDGGMTGLTSPGVGRLVHLLRAEGGFEGYDVSMFNSDTPGGPRHWTGAITPTGGGTPFYLDTMATAEPPTASVGDSVPSGIPRGGSNWHDTVSSTPAGGTRIEARDTGNTNRYGQYDIPAGTALLDKYGGPKSAISTFHEGFHTL